MKKNHGKDSKSKKKLSFKAKIIIFLTTIIVLISSPFVIYKIVCLISDYNDKTAKQEVLEDFSKKYPILDKKLLGLKLIDQYIRYPNCSLGKCSNVSSVMNSYAIPQNMTQKYLQEKIANKLKNNKWENIEIKKENEEDTNYYYINATKNNTELWLVIHNSKITLEIEEN